jgi:hypothetical protein
MQCTANKVLLMGDSSSESVSEWKLLPVGDPGPFTSEVKDFIPEQNFAIRSVGSYHDPRLRSSRTSRRPRPPTAFNLTFDGKTVRRCHLKWRIANEVGVSFQRLSKT